MAENSYAQLIDDFEKGINVLKGETLTEYIKRMGGVDYESKAHGGSVGIEVLFNKKAKGGRVGFENGGWADDLTGEALSIYNSMSAYGAPDSEIQAKLQGQNLWSPDGTTTDTEQVTGIINQNIGGGGGGIGGLDLTFTEGAKAKTLPMGVDPSTVSIQEIDDYGTYEPRTGILGAWDKTKNFFSGLGTPKVRGTLGTRLANQPRLPLPASLASWSLSPFNEASRNYNPNFVDQLNFLETQNNMIGRDQGSGLLRYGPDSVLSGKNVISLAGTNNYQVALDNEIERLEGILEKNKDKWDADKIASWKAKFYDPAIRERNKANQEFALTQAEIEAKKKANELAKITGIDDVTKITGKDYVTGADPGTPGGWDPGKGGNYQGGNYGADPGTPGGWDPGARKDGGLATMFTRRR
jgi:hypothetical protein